MELSSRDIEEIVKQVISSMGQASISDETKKCCGCRGEYGVYEKMEDAIDAAYEAQKKLYNEYKVQDREKWIGAIRKLTIDHARDFAERIVEEGGMGNVEDKILKHMAVAEKTPGPECLTTTAESGDNGLMLYEYAPFGVIGAITPMTNPTETIINNAISMISGGNTVVFNVHPRAKECSRYCVQLINKTIQGLGAPANLITMVKEPTMDTVDVLTASPKIRLMVGTGGMGMVNALLKSGKKTIGAGAGNPPVVVDDTADIELAGREIYRGASFDNNILCFAEKEVFAVSSIADRLIENLKSEGAYLLTANQTEELLNKVFINSNGKYSVNKDWVGKDAYKILETIGVSRDKNCKLIICDVPMNHPFVMVEQLMPILPIVRCKCLGQAMDYALIAENGNRHTASMYSTNVDNMTRFAKMIETTIFVKNGATLRGVGIGGQGHTTMTIAGPTGEGLTCARSFTRRRRCQIADGGFRIV